MNLSVQHATPAHGLASFTHPLDPLSAAEIARAVTTIRDHFAWGDDLRVETIDIDEPAKEMVRSYRPDDPVQRIARFKIYRRGVMGVWEGKIDLGAGKVVAQAFKPDARAMVAIEEVLLIEATVKADPRFQEALRRRGLLDELEYMCVDPWTVGNFGHAIENGRRVLNCFVWMRTFPLDNYYAHPVEGLHALVDLATLEILRVEDHFEASGDYIPVPRMPLNFDADVLTEFREPSALLDVVQPAGAGFTVVGNKVTWENWDFRVGFNGREGLVLYTIGYTHGGRRRPIVYRASIAELVVPYGTTERSHYHKNVFDHGELGFGRMANSLTLGCDCLGVIHYFDGVVPNLFGEARTIKNAVCLHEEDAGLSWKHFDVRTERTEVRRARRLVISSISTIGNYEYASYWYLHQDGRIEFEMKATGIINTAACRPGQPGRFGAEVAPGLVGHIHQHIFCARLDMEIDGPNNTVVECDTAALPPGPENPVWQRLRGRGAGPADRAGGAAQRRLRQDALLEDHQSGAEELGRPADGLQARGGLAGAPLHSSRQPVGTARSLHPASTLGDSFQSRRTLPGGRIRQPVDRGRRPCDLERPGSAGGEYGRRAMAQLRAAPSAATGGSPRPALHLLWVQANARRLLRSESGHRPAEVEERGKLLRLRGGVNDRQVLAGPESQAFSLAFSGAGSV